MPHIPDGYVSLLIADTGRASQWERGLRSQGVSGIMRIEAPPHRFDQGEWQLLVPRDQATTARSYLRDVMNGAARLPLGGFLSPTGRRALIAIVVILAGLIALPLFCSM
ncbi:MAG: hypothetical protein KAI47_13225 [Deltaproteobacteria bacterium]|nr:hypothetical protein [Deltaproteobacteria bacterium]